MRHSSRADDSLHRRSWLARTGSALLLPGALETLATRSRPAIAAEVPGPGLIVRNSRPLDLETPVSMLDGAITANDRFFIRSHFGIPAVGASPWRIELKGEVDRPQVLSLDDLEGFARSSVTAVLQCAGNGRGFYRPGIPGVGWLRGGVGNAEWSGVRLSEILEKAGLKKDAAHVHFLGADGPPSPKTPLFLRSVPIDKIMHPDTLLATEMNGEPLPTLHGGPVRLIVPGWTGNSWMKWVRLITVSEEEAPGFFMQTGYRLPKTPAPPDAVLKPSDLVPVTTMNVKSLITAPLEGAKLPQGRQTIRGVAWTGDGRVTRVEVASGKPGLAPTWRDAAFIGPLKPWSWRVWESYVEVTQPGSIVFRSRATDSRGETQPESPPWNRSGYLWNGIDRVNGEVL